MGFYIQLKRGIIMSRPREWSGISREELIKNITSVAEDLPDEELRQSMIDMYRKFTVFRKKYLAFYETEKALGKAKEEIIQWEEWRNIHPDYSDWIE
jgi:hypothetical protein